MKAARQFQLLFLLGAALLLAAHPAQAEYRLETGLALSEEYNDNVFLMPVNPMADYITRVVPSFHAVYSAPAWDWDFFYAFDYRYYAYDTRKHDSTQDVRLTNHTSIIRDSLFLDVRDRYYRTSLDTVRDYTSQSLFLNQTDVNEFVVTPYLNLNLASHTSGTLGYQYRNVWYRETTGINKQENTAYFDARNELSARTSANAGARAVRTNAGGVDYSRYDVYAGPRFEYQEGSRIWLIVGNSWFDWAHEKGTQVFWDGGIMHRFVSYTITFDTALTYIDDPERIQRREDRYTLSFLKQTDRVLLSLIAGRWEYRNILTKRLKDTRHGIGGTFAYSFSTGLRGSYSFNVDRYDDNQMRTYSMVYIDTIRLEYEFPASTVLSVAYSYNHGYSPDAVNYLLNYDNNRVVLEVRKTF